MLLIKNALVKTMAGPDLPNGSVLIDNGRILAVGTDVTLPDGAEAEIIDADGAICAPGFVDAHCHIGMEEEGIGFEGDDVNEINDPLTPQLRAVDAINPRCEAYDNALANGVTTVVTGPGSANVVGGTFLAMKTCGNRVDDMIVKNPVAMKIAFGENPKRCYKALNKSPRTRMATAALLREMLFKARNYADELAASEADPDKKAPTFDMKLHAMLPVMRGEIPLKAHAHRADDIYTAIRIADEFGLKITLDHCTEGHLIVDDLVKANKPVFVGPSLTSKTKYELQNKTFDTPRILAEAGIKFGIITDAPVIPIQYLPLCAGLAVRAGLAPDIAWRAITIHPAELIGIADRVGSIEVGKDADLTIFNGDPLADLSCTVRYTVVDGKIVYRG